MMLSQLDSVTFATTVVTAVPGQVSSMLAGEAIVLDIQAGIYYGLNEVGARIWDLIQRPTPLAQVRNTLLAEYDVEAEICDRDLLQLLQDLETAGLIEVHHAEIA